MTTEEKRPELRRSKRDRVFAGVCGGIGEFYGISPFWFRLAFVIATLPGGVPGIAAYVLAAIIIPKAD